jgi:hypothetical protein
MSTPAARTATLTAILLLATAAVGHAQLGGLLKKGKDAAAGKAGESAAAQVPPKTVDVLPCAVTYDQLEALERGLQAELEAAPSAKKEAADRQKSADADQKAYDKATNDYNKKNEAWGACRDRVENDPATKKKLAELEAKSNADAAKAEAAVDEQALEAQARKMQAAAERVANGTATAADRQALADFQAQMAKLQQTGNAMVATNAESSELAAAQRERLAKCGEKPVQPTMPSSLGWSPERVLLEKGAKAAGMDTETYKVVRDCALKSANLRVTSKNYPDADKLNSKLSEIQQTLNSMRAAGVPI